MKTFTKVLLPLFVLLGAFSFSYRSVQAAYTTCAEFVPTTFTLALSDSRDIYIFLEVGDTFTISATNISAVNPYLHVRPNYAIVGGPLLVAPTATYILTAPTAPNLGSPVIGDTVLLVSHVSGTGGAPGDIQITVTCTPDQEAPEAPGLLTYGADIFLFPVTNPFEGSQNGLVAWGIDEEGNGFEAFYVTGGELAELPATPEENLLIAATDDDYYSFYRLTTGEYQINIGPDAEGKVQVIIFDGIPPTNVYRRDYNINDIGEGEG